MNLNEGGDGDFPSRFFKVILKDKDAQLPLELGIPTRFVMKHGNDMSDLVHLRVPGGDAWEVKLCKKDGKVWLRDGWDDFIKHYQISHGHFVVFSYLGESWFNVVILDTTACEIQYPIKPENGRRSRPDDEPHFVTDSKEVIDLELQPHTYRRSKRKKLVTVQQRPRPVDSIVGEECPSFEVVIHKSAAEGNCLHVPNSFSRIYLKVDRASNRATLKIMQRSWQIELIDYGSRSIRSYRMTGGWRKFTRDNDLRMGDVCIFKLIDKMRFVFEVVISKH